MIKTKSISEKPSKDDGIRILITRYKFPWIKEYQEWRREFAPSRELLKDWKEKWIDFVEYKRRYLSEMKKNTEEIKELAQRARTEIITLLCYEKTDEQCHRRLLKELIDGYGKAWFL